MYWDSEQALLLACRRGETQAFSQLVRQYQDEALRTAYLMTNDRQAAEDIAQNSFLNTFRHIHRFDTDRPFRPWFLTILTNEARIYMRGQRRRATDSLDASMAGESDTPLAQVIRADEQARIHAALAGLEEPFRTAVILYYFNDLSVEEVAAATASRPGTVKSRLFTARSRLRDALSWLQPHPTAGGQRDTREDWKVLGESSG